MKCCLVEIMSLGLGEGIGWLTSCSLRMGKLLASDLQVPSPSALGRGSWVGEHEGSGREFGEGRGAQKSWPCPFSQPQLGLNLRPDWFAASLGDKGRIQPREDIGAMRQSQSKDPRSLSNCMSTSTVGGLVKTVCRRSTRSHARV
jgi:hypothetical protein